MVRAKEEHGVEEERLGEEAKKPESDDRAKKQAGELARGEQEIGTREVKTAQRRQNEGNEEGVDGEDTRRERRKALKLPAPAEDTP